MKRMFLFFLCLSFLLSGCTNQEEPAAQAGRTVLTAWFHTGRPAEQKVMETQVERFNQANQDIVIQLTMIPEGEYNTQVQAAAADGKLPDILDLDGPYLANYAWKNHLLPMDGLLGEDLLSQLLPSIVAQGTYRGRLYAVGVFDSGLGLFGNRSLLEKADVRIPEHPEEAWRADEFEEVLARLSRLDPDGKVLDLRLDYRGEWYTYAFSPVIQSAGGDLIDRTNFQSASGVLDSPGAIAGAKRIQGWFTKGYVDPNTDTNSFVLGRVALSWCGHWEYPRYHEALGDDLVLMPLPDFGRGVKTAMGSWCWALSTNCRHPAKAARFLAFLLTTREVLAMCSANGAIPATLPAIQASPLYGPGGPLRLFVEQLPFAVPRPQTPAYPVITSAFQQAFLDIRHGADPAQALRRAAEIIDQDIRDNLGYPEVKP